jgi:cullin 1
MYTLLPRILEGVESLEKMFGEHVKKTGLAIVSKTVDEEGPNVDTLDPKAYIGALLGMHAETVARNFRGEGRHLR